MNLFPAKQLKLFGLNKYLEEIIYLFKNDKFPNKILLTGPKGSGKSTLAYHLINYIFSQNESNNYNLKEKIIYEENKSFKLISNNIHPNFYLIDLLDQKINIEISQIRKLIDYSNKSSFNNLPRLILIDNLEYLNINSLNALLKIIEEPNYNMHFILIHNSNKKIADTLRSRCLSFKIHLTFDESILISNQLLDQNLLNFFHHDLISHYDTPGNFVNLANFTIENKIDIKNLDLKNFLALLITKNYYKKDDFIKNNISKFIELFFLKRISSSNNQNKLNSLYFDFIKKMSETKKFNLDLESLFIEFENKILNA